MDWWQNLIMILVPVVVGALIGYFFNRLGAKHERRITEIIHLQDAVSGLLVEMEANIKLTERQPEPALLPRLAKDMWNMHKSSVCELPFAVQESLYQAYVSIDKVNAVVETRIAYSSGHGYNPRSWDTRYENEAKGARELMERARDNLRTYLDAHRNK